MPRQPPDHVARNIMALALRVAPFESDRADEQALYQLLVGRPCPLPQVELAHDVFLNEESRHVLNAAILCRATNEQISAAFEVTTFALDSYRHLFFDRDVFRHVFDIKTFIDQLKDAIPDRLHAMYMDSYERGFETLSSKYQVGAKPTIEVKKGVQELFGIQVTNAKKAIGVAITSQVAKEALRWSEAACSTASILLRKDSNPSDSSEQLRMLLDTKDHTVKREELPDADELIH